MKRTTVIVAGIALAMLTAVATLPQALAAPDDEKIAVYFEFDGKLANTMEAEFAKVLRADRFENIEPVRNKADADVHVSLYAQSLSRERDILGLAIVNDDGLSYHWTSTSSPSHRSNHAPAMLAQVQHAGR